MKVLIIGSGGREHAIAKALNKSSRVTDIFLSPGNGGTHSEFENVVLDLTAPFTAVADFCKVLNIGLVVVGPENYLADGIVDALQSVVPTFGPVKAAAYLESSKIFAKEIMTEAGVKTAAYEKFSDYQSAVTTLTGRPMNYVIKANGLCAGKGVVVPESEDEALKALDDFFNQKVHGAAGEEIIIEEKLYGQEASILGFCDGESVKLLPPSQDHKRIYDDDRGPNTGGMGVYSPVKFLNDRHLAEIETEVFLPMLKTMSDRGTPYRGILYAGLMVDGDNINVIEFNVRFGDPECQCVLPLLQTDLVELMLTCIEGRLSDFDDIEFRVLDAPACTIIIASEGYPGRYPTNLPITGLDQLTDNNITVCHAGTKAEDGQLLTSGGRVLAVTATGEFGDSLQSVIDQSYQAVKKISFLGCYFRNDIGRKGL